MSNLLFYIIGILGIIVIGKLLLIPLKIVWKLVSNAIVGGFVLFFINLLGQYIGFYIEITPLKALIVGVLGVPGIIILALI